MRGRTGGPGGIGAANGAARRRTTQTPLARQPAALGPRDRARTRPPSAVGGPAAGRAGVERDDPRTHHGLPLGGQRARLARRRAKGKDLRDGRTARGRGRGAGLDGLRETRVAPWRKDRADADARGAAGALALPRRAGSIGRLRRADRAAAWHRAAPVRPRRLPALGRAPARRRPLRHYIFGDPQCVRAAEAARPAL